MNEIGNTLPNGAEILAIDRTASIVLAKFRDREFVTWCIDRKDNCYWGHYFDEDIVSAGISFKERVAAA
jgi:hypothetical protein